MKRTIAIIDADICFTYLLASRLQKHLPDVMAFPVSAEVLRSHRTLILDNDFVLYNQHEISENEILRHCVKEHLPILIPLLSTKAPYPPKDVLMLLHEVESRAGLGRIPLPKGSSVQTCLALSFISPEEREAHVRNLLERSRSDFRHIIRLDLMPGIRMATDPPSWNQEGIPSTSGISSVLSKLKYSTINMRDIPSYLEPDPYGDLRFGRPVHSDDVISAHARTILRLINFTYRYLQSLGEPSLLLVVADSLSFTRMRTLAKALRHLELMTPLDMGTDYMLLSEIDAITKAHVGTSHVNLPLTLTKEAYSRRPKTPKKGDAVLAEGNL